MIVRVARIEVRATRATRATRADVQGALFGEAPIARLVWELPGPRETCWLVQVAEHLAHAQRRRFAHLRFTADVVGYRNVEVPDEHDAA